MVYTCLFKLKYSWNHFSRKKYSKKNSFWNWLGNYYVCAYVVLEKCFVTKFTFVIFVALVNCMNLSSTCLFEIILYPTWVRFEKALLQNSHLKWISTGFTFGIFVKNYHKYHIQNIWYVFSENQLSKEFSANVTIAWMCFFEFGFWISRFFFFLWFCHSFRKNNLRF